jgi:hypothetical protein
MDQEHLSQGMYRQVASVMSSATNVKAVLCILMPIIFRVMVVIIAIAVWTMNQEKALLVREKTFSWSS